MMGGGAGDWQVSVARDAVESTLLLLQLIWVQAMAQQDPEGILLTLPVYRTYVAL